MKFMQLDRVHKVHERRRSANRSLIEYVALYQQGDSTIEARKNLLIEQRKDLLEKQAEIAATIERLNYKIDNYEKICAKVIK